MIDPRRALAYLSAIALAGSLAACGGSSSSPTPVPTPTPTPTPPPPQVVAQVTGGALEADFVGWVPFTTTRAGSLDATVDWTFATNDIDVYLVQGNCNLDQLAALQCPILAFSESTTAKPERIRVASAAAGSYTLFVANAGPGDESISFQVVLTPSATGAAAPSASSRGSEGSSVRLKFRPRGSVELR